MKSEIRHGDSDQPSYPSWNSLSKRALTVLLSSSFVGCSQQQEEYLRTAGVPRLSPDGIPADSVKGTVQDYLRLRSKIRSDATPPKFIQRADIDEKSRIVGEFGVEPFPPEVESKDQQSPSH